jgi:hypothetical protein
VVAALSSLAADAFGPFENGSNVLGGEVVPKSKSLLHAAEPLLVSCLHRLADEPVGDPGGGVDVGPIVYKVK